VLGETGEADTLVETLNEPETDGLVLGDTGERVGLGDTDSDTVELGDTGDTVALGVILCETRETDTLAVAENDTVELGDTGEAVLLEVMLGDTGDADTLPLDETVAEEEGVKLGEGIATAGRTIGDGTPTIALAATKATFVQFERSVKVALSTEVAEVLEP